jgi:ribosomal protein S18 acetylase RimI-like enzyme
MVATDPTPQKEALLMAQRGKPPEGYYTASTARRKLGNISDGMLRSLIQRGLIQRDVPPGRKQGFYKRETVDKLAKEIQASWHGGTLGTGTKFRQATLDDLDAIADIDERTFNASEDDPEPRQAYLQRCRETYSRWMQRNSQATFVLTNAANKVVGFISLLPLKKSTLDDLVHDRIQWTEIPNEDIELFEPQKPLHIYVIALCVDPSYKGTLKEKYGAWLISRLFNLFFTLAKQGIEIETITARNALNKPDGKRLLQGLGIPQLRSPTPSMHLFSVRVAEAGNPLLSKYYDTLMEWKKKHQED